MLRAEVLPLLMHIEYRALVTPVGLFPVVMALI
jgi:hypothetical protein